MLQHGSYTLLIDACYDREQFPTLDEAIEWTWASTKEEVEAVEFVLRKFFVLEDGHYVQKRIEEEILEYQGKSEKNKRIAIERETNRKKKHTERAQLVNESPPNQEPRTKNHKPRTINQEPKDKNNINPIVGQNHADDDVSKIFDYWKKVMNSPRSVLDDKRKSLIAKSIKKYSPSDICKAIRGCSKSPHNMGDNQQKTKYNGLGLILRDADHIDRFIELDAGTARAARETGEQHNARVVAEFLGEPVNDENTIEMRS